MRLQKYGDVAQLARALDWQSRGRGFESHLLHKKSTRTRVLFCFLNFYDGCRYGSTMFSL